MNSEQPVIHPQTQLGFIHLAVSELDPLIEFYQSGLGFQQVGSQGNTVLFGVQKNGMKRTILSLSETRSGRLPQGTTGLYHFAIRVPSRLSLSESLHRLVNIGWALQGFSDHGVSEAVYLADPDGNGIEIYRDRPRSEWPTANGEVQMKTNPLDVDRLLAEANPPQGTFGTFHPDTILGHVHLRVASIPESEAFYCSLLGFELMQRYGPMASFVSAGGYHHHIGFNTWESAGAPAPSPDSLGLRWFSVVLPDPDSLEAVLGRLRKASWPVEEHPDGWLLKDPSQNGVLLTLKKPESAAV